MLRRECRWRPIKQEFDLSLSEIRLQRRSPGSRSRILRNDARCNARISKSKDKESNHRDRVGRKVDATSCVQADLCAITTISEDHMEVLGPTLIHILREKAGIHREGVPLLMLNTEHSDLVDEARRIIGGDLIIHSPGNRDSPWAISRSMAVAIGDMLGWEVDRRSPVARQGL